MRIETERLIIDGLRPGDKENYFVNISHDRQILKTFVCQYQENMETFRFEKYLGRTDLFAIREKKSDALIGIFTEFSADHENRSLEIGYALGSRHWGKGYMTEAVQAMLDYYFRHTELRTVYASFFPENTASKRVMEKCGMRYSHTVEKEFSYLGKERDLIYYKAEAVCGKEGNGI